MAAPGAQLKAQREAMGWSVEQVSDQLKLAPRQVLALEQGDTAALPNRAVVRGFIRAYAKVVKLDAAPLVAMIDINPAAGADAAPARRELSHTFSETRFPSLTQRSSKKPVGWIVGAVLVVAVVAFGAYKLGYITPAMLSRGGSEAASAVAAASSAATGAVSPAAVAGAPAPDKAADSAATPLISPSVPLISVPPTGDRGSDAATAPVLPASPPTPAAATTAAPAAVAPAAVTPAPAAAAATSGDNALVLTVREDSWVQLRPTAGGPALISRLVKAGSTETINLTGPALLVVGKPGGVEATLRGAPLRLPLIPGGTTSRVNLK